MNWTLDLRLVLGISFVVVAAIIGILIHHYTEATFIQTFTVIGTIVGTISLVYVIMNSHGYSEEGQNSSSQFQATQNKSSEDDSRTPPSSGLTPEEQSVQNEMIKRDYQRFFENPVPHIITRQPRVNGPSGDWDADGETVRKVWKVSKDDGFYKKRKNSHKLAPKGIDRAEELGENILLDEEIQDEILEVLLQGYRDDPTRPAVSRDELIEAVACSEDELDHNIWLLEEKGYLGSQGYAGDSRGYREAEITQLGKRVTE